jgi:hypothetical protein
MSPLSLTPSQLKVSLFFAALLWFVSVLENNFYLMVLIPWAAFIFVTTWKRANPAVAIFEEKPEPKPKHDEPAPAAEKTDEKPAEA